MQLVFLSLAVQENRLEILRILPGMRDIDSILRDTPLEEE